MKKLESYSLSEKDILQVLPRVKVVMYPNLSKMTDYNDLFDKQGRCVLFFEEQKLDNADVGHWEAIIKDDKGKTINFFDSYGLAPDECEKWLNANEKRQFNEGKPELHRLLKLAASDGYRIYFNHKKLQSYANNISTCGRFVCTRLLHKNLNNQEFINLLNGLKNEWKMTTYDQVVTKYIYDIIKK